MKKDEPSRRLFLRATPVEMAYIEKAYQSLWGGRDWSAFLRMMILKGIKAEKSLQKTDLLVFEDDDAESLISDVTDEREKQILLEVKKYIQTLQKE